MNKEECCLMCEKAILNELKYYKNLYSMQEMPLMNSNGDMQIDFCTTSIPINKETSKKSFICLAKELLAYPFLSASVLNYDTNIIEYNPIIFVPFDRTYPPYNSKNCYCFNNGKITYISGYNLEFAFLDFQATIAWHIPGKDYSKKEEIDD